MAVGQKSHAWWTLRAKFVEGNLGGGNVAAFWRALDEDWKAKRGPRPPNLKHLNKVAAKGKWSEARAEIMAKAQARSAEVIVEREKENLLKFHDQTNNFGAFLMAMAAQWIQANPGSITNLYEALAAARTGTQIQRSALEGIADLKGIRRKPTRQAEMAEGESDDGDEKQTPEEIRADIERLLLRRVDAEKTKRLPAKPEKPEPGAA